MLVAFPSYSGKVFRPFAVRNSVEWPVVERSKPISFSSEFPPFISSIEEAGALLPSFLGIEVTAPLAILAPKAADHNSLSGWLLFQSLLGPLPEGFRRLL